VRVGGPDELNHFGKRGWVFAGHGTVLSIEGGYGIRARLISLVTDVMMKYTNLIGSLSLKIQMHIHRRNPKPKVLSLKHPNQF
jgi:hypothetical protein